MRQRVLTGAWLLGAKVASVIGLCAAPAFAAPEVEVNRASEAELEAVKGIGPAVSARILVERGRRPFVDWADLARRVPGVGERQARRLSDTGLRVDGAPYSPLATASGTAIEAASAAAASAAAPR